MHFVSLGFGISAVFTGVDALLDTLLIPRMKVYMYVCINLMYIYRSIYIRDCYNMKPRVIEAVRPNRKFGLENEPL